MAFSCLTPALPLTPTCRAPCTHSCSPPPTPAGYPGAFLKVLTMNADQVRALVDANFPGVLQSPLAQAMHGASAMALLEASDADAVALRGEALEHARACLAACDGWTVETLGHNVQSAFGADLDADECDDIARTALGL